MKRFLCMGIILSWAALAAAQNITVGGMAALGSNVSSGEQVDKQDLKFREFFAGLFIEETTVLQLRVGKMQPRKISDTQLDLNYVGVTVSYLFDTSIGQEGFFAGPSYYTGHLIYPDVTQPDQPPLRVSVSKIGAMGGVEGFFPITNTFRIYGQIAGHYIPVSPHQITFDVGLGLVVRF